MDSGLEWIEKRGRNDKAHDERSRCTSSSYLQRNPAERNGARLTVVLRGFTEHRERPYLLAECGM